MTRGSPVSLVVSSIILLQVYRIQVLEGCSISCPPGEAVKCTCPFWNEPINPAGCNGAYCTAAGSCDPAPEWCPPGEYKCHTTKYFNN